MASGSRPHSSITAPAASGSAPTLPAPTNPVEQGQRLRPVHHVQRIQAGALELTEPSPAGDDGEAFGPGRQHRPHLAGARGVVQNHQDPAAGERAPPTGRPGIGPVRNLLIGHPDHAEQQLERHLRRQWLGFRRVAPQIAIQLPVREAIGQPVREMDDQRGLAHSCHAVDRDDGSDGGGGEQVVHVGVPTGEIGQVVRKGAGHVGAVYAQLTSQQLLVQTRQFRARVGAQLVSQSTAQRSETCQRVRCPARSVQRAHVQRQQRLPERRRRDQRRQLGGNAGCLTCSEPSFHQLLGGRQPKLVPPRSGGPQLPAVEAGQCRPTPQCDGLGQGGVGSVRRQPAELGRVEPRTGRPDPITDPRGLDPARDPPSQGGHDLVNLLSGGRWRVAVPQPIDQHARGNGPVRREQQCRQQLDLLPTTKWYLLAAVGHFDRAEDPEFHPPEGTSESARPSQMDGHNLATITRSCGTATHRRRSDGNCGPVSPGVFLRRARGVDCPASAASARRLFATIRTVEALILGGGMLLVSLLGEQAIIDEATGTVRTRSSRTVGLVAFLVAHTGSPQTRQRIAGLFWPDSTDAQALTNLRRELHHLRHALGEQPSLVVTSRDLCWRDTDTCHVDLRTFDIQRKAALAAAAAGDREGAVVHATSAVAQYRGEFLPGSYDDWLLDARSELERQCVDLCDLICESRARRGDLTAAVHAARRRIQLQPLEELGYRTLMELQTDLGDRAGAVSTYHHCASVLERELGVVPDEATRKTLQRLMAHGHRSGAPPPASEPVVGRSGFATVELVGRSRELGLLQDLWRSAAAGRPSLALVRGGGGVGKTRLVAEVAEMARLQGAVVASTQCFGTSGRLALAPVAEWLRNSAVQSATATLEPVWRAEIDRLVPSGNGRGEAGAGSRAMVDAWQRHRFSRAWRGR